MWHSGTWFTGGLGSARLIVGLHDLRNLFQLKWLHDCLSVNAPATPSQSNNSPKGCLVLQWRWLSEQSKPGALKKNSPLAREKCGILGDSWKRDSSWRLLFPDIPITNYKTQAYGKMYVYRFLLKSAILVLTLQWTSQEDTQKPLGLLRLWF